MTVSTPETSESSEEKKQNNKYKRGPRYNHESLPLYSKPYMYYPPPSVHYPTAKRDDDDLEIIMHKDNTSSADWTRRSDQSKTADLKEQLEYYFSRQNLVNDTYLVSQMDNEFYVPVSIIANFRRVREWTTDLSIIVKTLRESSTVTVNELGTRVKPNISVQRKTVIMRDVPDCTRQEIDDLLKELDSPPVQSIKQDIGNMWYFTFESEDNALKLLTSVRGKSFKDQAIAARMKSEPVLRVNQRSTIANVPQLQQTPVYYGNYYNYQPQVYPRRPYINNNNENRYNQKTQVSGRSSLRVAYRPKYIQNNKTHVSELENDMSQMAISNGDNKRAPRSSNINNKHYKSIRPSSQQGQTYARPNNNNRRINHPETSAIEVVSHTESSSAPPRRQEPSNDNKKKKINNTANTNNATKQDFNRKKKNKTTNNVKNKDEELKPMHFPPLPTLYEATKTASTTDPARRSAADVVKSNPNKEKETEVFPIFCIQNEEFKSNPFSYADMLKRKDQQ